MSEFDVLLIVPPGAPGTTPNREGASGLGACEGRLNGFRYAPQTVAQCGATLRAAGLSVAAIDAPATGESIATCLERILEMAPRAVAVQVSWATREADAAFLDALRARSEIQAITIAFGSSARWMESALGAADHILLGEPDLALARLCRVLLVENKPWPPRVWAQTVSPEDHTPTGMVANLDLLPAPAWDILPLAHYDHLSVLSSRGCSEQCLWCPYVVSQGDRFRSRSPQRVLDELTHLVEAHQPRRIIFRDPVFALDSERVSSLCHLILSEPSLRPGKSLKWECESRPAHFGRDLLRLMRLAGCIGVKVGLETVDGELLTRHRRVPDGETTSYLETAKRMARDCARFGIACRAYVMVGLSGQTVEMAQETARFVQDDMQPTSLAIKPFVPYPGLRTPTTGLPEAPELPAQMAPLIDAQRLLKQHSQPGPPRWRRAIWRIAYRAGALWRRKVR